MTNHTQPVPHQKVILKHPIIRLLVPNLLTDFILLVPDYPNRLELSYPKHCFSAMFLTVLIRLIMWIPLKRFPILLMQIFAIL